MVDVLSNKISFCPKRKKGGKEKQSLDFKKKQEKDGKRAPTRSDEQQSNRSVCNFHSLSCFMYSR